MAKLVALLRGINVGGTRKVPMAELRVVCTEAGFGDVVSHIQSGNIVFEARGRASAAESALQAALEDRFGFHVDVVARTARQWAAYVRGNPMRTEAERDPSHVLLALAKRRPQPGAAAALRERAAAGERIEAVGDALWFHYPNGLARSKLTPSLIDRLVGSSVTARNWNTVTKLAELAGVTA